MPQNPIGTKMQDDYRRMDVGIALAIKNWSMIEINLASILQAILYSPQPNVGTAIYYTPNNTETRLAIVDAAMFYPPTINEDTSRVIACWTKLLGRINRAKNTRNKIVHGNVALTIGPSGQHVRLTGPVLDPRHSREALAAIEKRQIPGMSPNNVVQAAENFGTISEACYKLRRVMTIMAAAKSDAQQWRETLAELEADLNLGDQSQDAQNRSEPQAPDQSPPG